VIHFLSLARLRLSVAERNNASFSVRFIVCSSEAYQHCGMVVPAVAVTLL